MKKIISFLLSFCLILSTISVANASYNDVDISSAYFASAQRLQDLGIITGYDDGSFRPDSPITRAEFTKIIVCMMDKEMDAMASSVSSGFCDVKIGTWYTPYINYATSKEILSGYADGYFAPNNTITLAEAVTVLLRTLGYSEEKVGYYWPDNYITVASTLKITSGIECNANDPITRAIAAVLVDRALFTKPQDAQTTNDTYLETVGYTVLKDALILDNDTKSDNVTILSGNMKQNSATAYLRNTQHSLVSGDIYNYAVIDRHGYLSAVREYMGESNICSVTGAINKLTENTIEYTTTQGLKTSYRADDNFIVYSDGIKYNFANAKSKITSGTDITFYGNNYGLWNVAVIGASDNIDPILASKDYTSDDTYLGLTPINSQNLVVYRNGEYATLGDIKSGDVIYYNTKTNVMDVYSKKVTGTYYSAYPSKAYVESVTVAGKSYEIGYSAATNRLDASENAFNIGDKITLLLGKNDKVVFVTDNSASFDYSSYGVIIKSESRVATEGANDGNSEYITTLFMTDGEEHDIPTNKLYQNDYGKFVRLSYSNGVATLSQATLSDKSNFVGEINLAKRTINGRYFLKDAAIIQLTSDEDSSPVTCEILNFDSLTASRISDSQLISAVSANKFGDIAILFVKNFENTDNFGIVSGSVKTNEKSGTKTFKIFSNGVEKEYTLSGSMRVNSAFGAGISFRVQNGQLTKLTGLTALASGIATAVDGSRILIGNTVYTIGDNPQIFNANDSSKIKSIDMTELLSMKNPSVTIYSDKSLAQGGVVRVITVR